MTSLLAESLAVLAAELPVVYVRMCTRLEGRTVGIQVDRERFVVAFAGGQAKVRAAASEREPMAEVRISTTRRTILEVIDAQMSLADAVLTDGVEVVGALERLVEAREGLLAYVHGAVRCPSFPALLKRFRSMLPRESVKGLLGDESAEEALGAAQNLPSADDIAW